MANYKLKMYMLIVAINRGDLLSVLSGWIVSRTQNQENENQIKRREMKKQTKNKI
jgi:hypothetical protein